MGNYRLYDPHIEKVSVNDKEQECLMSMAYNEAEDNHWGYKLRPVFWGEPTPDILQQEKERKIFIGEDLYGKTDDIQPDFACGYCGELFFLGNKG